VRDLLRVLYLPAKHCIYLMSAHSLPVSVSHFKLLKWETPTFISSGLWLQHLDVNSVNYKMCIKIQQRVFLGKIYNVNWPTLWYGWHGLEQRVMNNATEEWCKHLWLCSCKRTTFLVFNLTEDSTFVHFNLFVWWKLQVRWCYCVEYTRFSPFFIFLYFTR